MWQTVSLGWRVSAGGGPAALRRSTIGRAWTVGVADSQSGVASVRRRRPRGAGPLAYWPRLDSGCGRQSVWGASVRWGRPRGAGALAYWPRLDSGCGRQPVWGGECPPAAAPRRWAARLLAALGQWVWQTASLGWRVSAGGGPAALGRSPIGRAWTVGVADSQSGVASVRRRRPRGAGPLAYCPRLDSGCGRQSVWGGECPPAAAPRRWAARLLSALGQWVWQTASLGWRVSAGGGPAPLRRSPLRRSPLRRSPLRRARRSPRATCPGSTC